MTVALRRALRRLGGLRRAVHTDAASWRAAWAAHPLPAPAPESTAPPQYILSQFPYPSGKLHMGHVRVYTISDTLARAHALKTPQSPPIHPMGWDAFGLPAENAAMQHGLSPAVWTRTNIDVMRSQMALIGADFDWSRSVTTCDPDYYRWTQFIFLRLFRAGIAYQREAEVNWDPVDRTVLANEQIDDQGRSWRSGALAEKRTLKQWFLRITDYAPRLLADLDRLHDWPAEVVSMQRRWIGASPGAEFAFPVGSSDAEAIRVFTTRPETLLGVTFLAVPPAHPLADRAVARHPLTGRDVPVVGADYVVQDYGTAAVMGVPGHDDRDRRLAEERGLPIETVVDDDAGVLVNCGAPWDGMPVAEARTAILAAAGGSAKTSYKLRDWLISRQRMWGAPIPIIHCRDCGPVPVPEADLPVLLPDLEALSADPRKPAGVTSKLALDPSFAQCVCPRCGSQDARRETDTMDTFVDSSWYFLRYLDPANTDLPFARDAIPATGRPPVDVYVGGIEHAILHLLYARFFTKFLADDGLLPPGCDDEPFAKLLAQGMVTGRTFKDPATGAYLTPDQVTVPDSGPPLVRATGAPCEVVFEKMSKSKSNGVDPERTIAAFGVDTVRLFMLFKAPVSVDLQWDETAIVGQSRWIARLWLLVQRHLETAAAGGSAGSERLWKAWALCIDRVTSDIFDTQQFNTAIAQLMTLSNVLASEAETSADSRAALAALVVMLHPMAPHTTAAMWHALATGRMPDEAGAAPADLTNAPDSDIRRQRWPAPPPPRDIQPDATVDIVITVNGRKCGTVAIPAAGAADKESIEDEIRARMDDVHKMLGDGQASVDRLFVARNLRLVNLVVKKQG